LSSLTKKEHLSILLELRHGGETVSFRFANRMQRLRTSDIREILRVTQRPSVISFAGGLPGATTFPVEELKAIGLEVLDREGAQALQYSTSEGQPALREWIARRMWERQRAAVSADEILVTAGSQQGLDLLAKAFLEPGDCFFPTDGHANTLRLNFSNMPEERITEGIARLGEALRGLLAEEAKHEPAPAA
jgi:DNA-binding transcriptional MocR family regulator